MAAENGLAEAQFQCGLLYYHGEGVERDIGEAHRYFELAANQGREDAQHNLAVLRGAHVRH